MTREFYTFERRITRTKYGKSISTLPLLKAPSPQFSVSLRCRFTFAETKKVKFAKKSRFDFIHLQTKAK